MRSCARRGLPQAPASASASWFPLFLRKRFFLVVFRANDSHGKLMFAVCFSGLFRFCGKGWTLSCQFNPSRAHTGIFSREKIKVAFKRMRMVSGGAPTKADDVFRNISYFKMYVWRRSRGGCGSLRERDEGRPQSQRQRGHGGARDPPTHLGSPSPHSISESAFPNLLVFLPHRRRNGGQRCAGCL